MVSRYDGKDAQPNEGNSEELHDIEQLLIHGVTLHQNAQTAVQSSPAMPTEEEDEQPLQGDIQQALAVFADAAQDMATATVELSLGRHFACADFCNQAVEKAVQAISVLRFGRRSSYDHDLRALGTKVGAPANILEALTILTPFHPEAFYAETPPEEADEVISADQASEYVQYARTVMRWARNLVLQA